MRTITRYKITHPMTTLQVSDDWKWLRAEGGFIYLTEDLTDQNETITFLTRKTGDEIGHCCKYFGSFRHEGEMVQVFQHGEPDIKEADPDLTPHEEADAMDIIWERRRKNREVQQVAIGAIAKVENINGGSSQKWLKFLNKLLPTKP